MFFQSIYIRALYAASMQADLCIFRDAKDLCRGEALGVMQHVYVYERCYASHSLM